MKRKRLTREDSRDQTKASLLVAAQKLIAKKGLAATSVEDIAAAAGYSRGAFYSNFATKGDLFIELLRCDHAEHMSQFDQLKNEALSLDEVQQRSRQLYSGLISDNESFLNWTEARMLAARDAKFRAKLNAFMAEKRDHIAEFIAYFYQRAGVAVPLSAGAMAAGFMSLAEGMQLFMLSSPLDIKPEMAEGVLSFFVDAVMELARLRRPQSV